MNIISRNRLAVYIGALLFAFTMPFVVVYGYQRLWSWSDYWDGTQGRANSRVAETVKNFIEFYGPVRFAKLPPEQIQQDYSNLGYNLNLVIVRDGEIEAVSSPKYFREQIGIDNHKIHYQIPCSDIEDENICSIYLLEDVTADARNLNNVFVEWMVNPSKWFTSKYDFLTGVYFPSLIASLIVFALFVVINYVTSKLKRLSEELIKARNDAASAQKNTQRELDEFISMADLSERRLVDQFNKEIGELREKLRNSVTIEDYEKVETDRLRLEERLKTARTTKEVKKVFNGIFENVEFSDAFASSVRLSPGDSVSRKVCTLLSYFNKGNINPFPNQRKQWKGDTSNITDRIDLPLMEYDIGSKERLFYQLTENNRVYVANIDYQHTFSDGK